MYAGVGTITKIEGLENLGDNVVFKTITKPIGYEVQDLGSFNQNVAIVQFVYEDKNDLKLSLDKIHDNLRVLDEQGNNMVLRMLYDI